MFAVVFVSYLRLPPKKKQKLYASPAEQQQLLEDFYNDLDDETFLGHEFGGKGEDESNISCSYSDTDVDVSDKDTDCTSQPVDEEDLVPRKQKFKNLDDVLDLNNYDILPPPPHPTPKNLLLFIILTQKDNL